jgi:hypothetical protein
MTFTINTNCHITLQHNDVNAGDPYGFVLSRERFYSLGPPVKIFRDVESDGTTTVTVHFTIALADDLINPDGSQHSEGRSGMYDKLTDYLGQSESLTLTTSVGSIANLKAIGRTADEYHYGFASEVNIMFTNAATYFNPIDAETYAASVWDGTLSWASSYWR